MIRPILLGIFAATLLGSPAFALDEAKVKDIIRQYIEENPGEIMSAIQQFQVDQRNAEMVKAKEQAKTFNSVTVKEHDFPKVGAKNPKLMITEFFDYNCGYCKRALPVIEDVLKDHKDVQFVFVELPILGPSSLLAAQYSLAAEKQDKYFEYHSALMNANSQKTEEILVKIGKDLGLNIKKLKEDAKSEEINAKIEKNRELAQSMGISGTPGFIVGEEVIRGFLSSDQMKQVIKEQKSAS